MKGPIERGLHAELTIGRPHDVLAIEEDLPRLIVGPRLIAITHDALALHYRGLGDELVGLPSNLRLLVRFFEPFSTLPFDDRCVDSYGRIRNDLERLGTPIGPNDTFIAATATAHDLTLVTHNTDEFGRIPELAIVDWEVEDPGP